MQTALCLEYKWRILDLDNTNKQLEESYPSEGSLFKPHSQ